MLVEEYPVSVSWAKRDSSSSNHRRSSNSISYREMQQQIDWAAGNAQKQHSSQQSPAGFILDPSSGLYFHAESQVYYDPVSQLFYNCASQSYYRFDTKLNTYIHVDASSFASSNPPPKAVNPTEPQENAPPPSQPSTPKPEVPLQTATNVPASKPAPASVKFSILGKKQSKDMDRWNKKKGELVADELVEVKKPIAPIKIKSLPTTSVPKSEIHVQGGIRPRLYVSMEKLVCLLCQRKFKDERQLTKHELSSELHKQNLNLDEYTQVQRLEQSAASLGINLQPKSNPVVIKKRPPVLKRLGLSYSTKFILMILPSLMHCHL
uniref:OCRE domain-containing protein n=1 Tax=Spongospora subterranea TaxID=70186 RepID=A0A0H5R6B3_9EUKA|eukprot:CRZ09381.1 hypothetical protein [Spongospora subterranea]